MTIDYDAHTAFLEAKREARENEADDDAPGPEPEAVDDVGDEEGGQVMGLMPVKVDDIISMAFGGDAMKLLPKWQDIPEEFKDGMGNRWCKVFNDWFFFVLKNAKWTPKSGIDEKDALRHIKTCMSSWGPKQEHKEAGVAYLLSEFFDDVKYERAIKELR